MLSFPSIREFQFSPSEADEICCFAPLTCMHAAHGMRGNSEHSWEWGARFGTVFGNGQDPAMAPHPCVLMALCCCCTRALHLNPWAVPFQIPQEQLEMALLMKLAEAALVTCWLDTREGIGRLGDQKTTVF